MNPIEDLLPPEKIDLAIPNADSALEEVLSRLNGDVRVKSFPTLREAVIQRHAPVLEENGCGVLIAHGRTPAVTSLVLAAGRIIDPAAALRLVFVAGIPTAFDSEYLRTVGVIARACKDPDHLAGLLAASTPADFVSILSSVERTL